MLNRALAKLVFIAFWGMFFQCQVVGTVSTAQYTQSSQYQETKKGFCKKKLTNGKQELSVVTIGQSDQKQSVQPLDPGYIGHAINYLIASLQPVSSVTGVTFYPANHWSAAIHRANPNKAPPLSFLA